MKLKFKTEDKDIMIFAIFCVVLFYIVAIGYLNISLLIAEEKIHGFNPLPAFSSTNFPPVMVFFIVFLIVIVASVSSYFFRMEKGIGFEIGAKDEKGYTRWATEKEMKKQTKMVLPTAKTSEYAGIPLINNGREIWVDDGEAHSLIIGSTGSGKTAGIVHPMVKILAKKGESMIITDPKGEIYEENGVMLKEKGYNIILLNFRNPQRGNSWNPMQLPYQLYKEGNQDKANELLDDLAVNILYEEVKNDDPFWEKTSADYFAGLALGLFEDAKPEEINLNSISYMATVGEEKSLGTTYIKEYFSHKSQKSTSYISANSTLIAPTETKGGILAVFHQKMKIFSARENLAEMLSHSDFDMKDIGRKKTAVFLLIHDEKKTYHPLMTIFIKQCYETLIDVAQEMGGKLAFRTNFILDEFANMPPLKDATTMVTAARSRLIRFNFFIQNYAQLTQVYGKENADTIKGNCGNTVYLISSELSALEEISKLCGESKSKEKDKTDSRPLITVSDLQRLKLWEVLIMRDRMMPFKTKFTPNFKIDWGYETDKAEYITRIKNPIDVFDIKMFVENKRKSLFETATKALDDKPKPMASNAKPELDLDALIQRMDQKIAELEKEELEKTKQGKGQRAIAISDKKDEKLPFEKESEIVKDDIFIVNEEPVVKEEPKIEVKIPVKEEIKVEVKPLVKEEPKMEIKPPVVAKPEEKVKPKIDLTDFDEEDGNLEKHEENIKTEKKGFITDDQFFDDFFGDE